MNKINFTIIVIIIVLLNTCASSDSMAKYSDDFGKAESLAEWKRLCMTEGYPDKVDTLDINTTAPGCLFIKPKESVWWEGYHGSFLYKEISGDFVVTTKVKIMGRETEYPDYPNKTWQIAGLLLRVPMNLSLPIEQRKENWVFNTYGAGIMRKYLIDIGTNVDNKYTCYPLTGKSGWTELRIARIDKYIFLLSKNENEGWILRGKFKREDFPETLQVGMLTNSSGYKYPFAVNLKPKYSYEEYNTNEIILENKPDLRAFFDYIDFKTPAINAKDVAGIFDNNIKLLELFDF